MSENLVVPTMAEMLAQGKQPEVLFWVGCAGSFDDRAKKITKAFVKILNRANVPFADKEIFFGSIMEETDRKVSLIPDFISNCGMARVFAYFMEKKVQMTDEAIFSDISEIIKGALEKAHNLHADKKNISATAFEIALKQLV